jgi:hypothetical protein
VRSFQLLTGALSEDIKIRIFGLPTLRRRLEIEMNIAIKRSGNPSKNLSSGAKRRAEKFLRAGLTFGLISVRHEADLRSKKKLPLNLLFRDFS